MWVTFFNRKEKEIKWATRGKKIKVNAKNRKKASKHQRRSASKEKTKINRFGQLEDKRKVKKGSGYDICY